MLLEEKQYAEAIALFKKSVRKAHYILKREI